MAVESAAGSDGAAPLGAAVAAVSSFRLLEGRVLLPGMVGEGAGCWEAATGQREGAAAAILHATCASPDAWCHGVTHD